MESSRPPGLPLTFVLDIIEEAKFLHLPANQNIQNNYVFLSSYLILESAFGLEWCSRRLLPIGTYLHPMPDPDLRFAALSSVLTPCFKVRSTSCYDARAVLV